MRKIKQTEPSSRTDRGERVVSDRESCAHCSPSKRVPPFLEEKTENSITEDIDRKLHAFISNHFYMSPPSIANTTFDWFVNLYFSPGRQSDLVANAIENATKLLDYHYCVLCNLKPEPCTIPLPQDRRFDAPEWNSWPFNVYQQTFLLTQDWWNEATSNVRGVTQHHKEVLPFLTRQVLDAYSPLNFPWTNPVVINATNKMNGENFLHGLQNYKEDLERYLMKKPPLGAEQFKVGVNLATTKGEVIYQNRLIELIQYSPETSDVYAEPILIVPAWIMKYYILDLSPQNSLVKYLVEQGHTVFMISWKNPDANDAALGLEDYLDLGIMASLNAVSKIIPEQKINAAGYCLGGTLLAIAAAKLARQKTPLLNTVTLFASQIDFEEAGELLFFVDEAQLTYLEDMMSEKGYLEASKMAGTFYMLRSYDLVWSKAVEYYQLGNRDEMIDLMAWNADTTRMPYKMHSQYLRSLFLNNDLSGGRFTVNSIPVSLEDIKLPLFAVSTIKDHVSPWESVYKIHLFTDTDVTFVLTSGGHNAGIVSEPGHPHRTFQIQTHKRDEIHLSHDEWREKAPMHEGSWWPSWHTWLSEKSKGKTKPPSMGNTKKGLKPLRNAPGEYVLMK
jgi:polyhydroxyalkanoate synthase